VDRLGLSRISQRARLTGSPAREGREHIHLDAVSLRNDDAPIKPPPLRQQGTHAKDPRELGAMSGGQ